MRVGKHFNETNSFQASYIVQNKYYFIFKKIIVIGSVIFLLMFSQEPT